MNGPHPGALPLRDIELPAAVSWWPPAPGWWFAAGALLVLAGAAGWLAWRHRRARAARAALAELAAIEARLARDGDRHACAAALSRLARRSTLRWQGTAVAATTDAAWIAALERLGNAPLPPALHPVLTRAPYSPQAAARLDVAALHATAAYLAQLIRVADGTYRRRRREDGGRA